jgi:predicted nuclease of predicted toxin-antitoxin system
MKLLLDENLPKKLKNDLADFEVFTVQEMGWKTNGELLELMISNGFEALITADKNLQNQQSFKKYPIPVLTLNNTC